MANSEFIKAPSTMAWLAQFDTADQPAVFEMLRNMKLVGRDEFAESLRAQVLHRYHEGSGPVGLYAEREVGHWKGQSHRLFKETKTKRKTAYGVGPQPIFSIRPYAPAVGSEGIVAQMLSELCKEHKDWFVDHPGPDVIRERRIRRFFLVTDFIGSGSQVEYYLNAAWRVKSVKSWWSLGARGMRVEVVAFAGTAFGVDRIRHHPSQALVGLVMTSPVIDDFTTPAPDEIKRICRQYDPIKSDEVESMGFKGTGALIAFAHGVPNNAPRIFHKSRQGKRGWLPLFPARVTANTREHFKKDTLQPGRLERRLLEMRQKKLAGSAWAQGVTEDSRARIIVLAALSRGPRQTEAISGKTGLGLLEIEHEIAKAKGEGLIDTRRRLLNAGHTLLKAARVASLPKKFTFPGNKSLYYPQSLRAPTTI